MKNIIKLLPETVYNQIAAGEVIQRPSSVVKELVENSIDAGADEIQVIIKDAGKTLIQVIDNGCGMSEIDARLAFERHSTSKIHNADDLFKIKTKGFRGEALASIASIAHVEMKTRLHDCEIGTFIKINGNELIKNEPCSCQAGCSISVKNLFFNVPARRKFLKSDNVEMKHIYEEFHRLAIPHSNIKFKLIENGIVRFDLPQCSDKERIIQIFGEAYSKRLIPVELKTNYAFIKGYIVKPEFSKKNRGEQFLFVNDRFIRNPLLHKVILKSFSNYIPTDVYPGYFLKIIINPSEVDVNVHPSKIEVHFCNEAEIILLLETALKYAISSYNVAPSLDSDVEQGIKIPLTDINLRKVKAETIFNKTQSFVNKPSLDSSSKFDNLSKTISSFHINQQLQKELDYPEKKLSSFVGNFKFLVSKDKYIITLVKSGIMIVDIKNALERIIFERTKKLLENSENSASQALLQPEIIELSTLNSHSLLEILDELETIGLKLSYLGSNTFSCSAIPADWKNVSKLTSFIESILEDYQSQSLNVKQDKIIRLSLAIAKKMALKGVSLTSQEEINSFIEKLFSNNMPEISPSGKPVFCIIDYNEISNKFKGS